MITPKSDLNFDKLVGITDQDQRKSDEKRLVEPEMGKASISAAISSTNSIVPKSSNGTTSSSVMDIFSPVNKGNLSVVYN